jgi:hypothetical protein
MIPKTETIENATLGATWRQLVKNGYAPTSATHPDRMVGRFASIVGVSSPSSCAVLDNHPAAILLYPTKESDCYEGKDAASRRLIALVVTADARRDARQAKAIEDVLHEFRLNTGPVRITGALHTYLIRYEGEPIFEERRAFRARLCFKGDQETVYFYQATDPTYKAAMNQAGGYVRVEDQAAGSLTVGLHGEWRNGSPLAVPRDALPVLESAERAAHFISMIERARWGSRPLVAKSKEAAA